MPPHSSGDHALARFLRTVGTAALQLAQDLEAGSPPAGMAVPRTCELGGTPAAGNRDTPPALDNEAGVSPREITLLIGRDDEPNVRAALAALEKRGVAEQVPGVSPQRWRLARPYLPEPGISRYRTASGAGTSSRVRPSSNTALTGPAAIVGCESRIPSSEGPDSNMEIRSHARRFPELVRSRVVRRHPTQRPG